MQFTDARKSYLDFLQSNPNHFDANFELGLNYLVHTYDQTENSIPYLLAAEKNMPNDTVSEVYYYLGKAYHFSEEYEKAIHYFNKCNALVLHNKAGDSFKHDLEKNIIECNNGIYLQNKKNDTLFVFNIGDVVNTAYADYVPLADNHDTLLYFNSGRGNSHKKPIDPKNKRYFEDKYLSKKISTGYSSPTNFSVNEKFIEKIPNNFFHDDVVFLDYNETYLITYKNNKLYLSEWKNNQWEKDVSFEKAININHYQPHASISSDGKRIVFSSSSEPYPNGLDLYVSKRNSDGQWETATKLNTNVNTAFNEDSPNFGPDGKYLFFSSKGHNSVGGYDLFRIHADSLENGKPENMGFPLNSAGDDIYFRPLKDQRKFYFSSHRKKSFGDLDIYYAKNLNVADTTTCVDYTNPTYTVHVDATESIDKEGTPITYQFEFDNGQLKQGKSVMFETSIPGRHYATLNVIDTALSIVEENEKTIVCDVKHGNYLGFLPDTSLVNEKKIGFTFAQPALEKKQFLNALYKNADSTQYIPAKHFSHTFHNSTPLELKVQANYYDSLTNNLVQYCLTQTFAPGKQKSGSDTTQNTTANNNTTNTSNNTSNTNQNTNSNSTNTNANSNSFALETVYFDFDQYALTNEAISKIDKNLETLKKYPQYNIELSGHCDSRGKNNYNNTLSQNRIQSVMSYMQKMGFDNTRIVITYPQGENNLVNKCSDGVKCNEYAHALNRRVEFKLSPAK